MYLTGKGKDIGRAVAVLIATLLWIPVGMLSAQADTTSAEADRIEQLERTVELLRQEVQALKMQQETLPPATSEGPLTEAELAILKDAAAKLEKPGAQRLLAADSWLQKFELGGYGEMHANFNQGSGKDEFDLHRLVLYVGYEFSDWIRLHSEFELEHAFVSDGTGGELVVEQAYVDFLLFPPLNLRAGRILTPLGIINKWHEPTTFNGVERPAFAKYILPSTWASDGIGIFGDLTDQLSYELYVVNGLDGSGFDAESGIRGGRMHERPGLNEPAVTGRVDYRPIDPLRVGVSGYFGGLNNGNKGQNPGVDGSIRILSADFDLTLHGFDFRGAIAHNKISDDSGLPAGVAEEMFGWYLEGAYHFWPEAFKTGKLANSDAIVFVRYDSYDTQYRMPDGVAPDERYDRSDLTVGLSFKPIPNFVVKADYQFREHEADGEPGDLLNLGAGWEF